MKLPSLLILNVVLAAVVVLGLIAFTTMPSALQIIWTLVTIALAAVVVYRGFRKFFSSEQNDKPADKG